MGLNVGSYDQAKSLTQWDNIIHRCKAADPAAKMIIDPETGFLHSPTQHNGFSLEKKKLFISLFDEYFPDRTRAIKEAGASRQAIAYHVTIDPIFKACIGEIEESKTDVVEANLFTQAQNPKNFIATIAWLRAYRGQRYNETTRVIHAKEPSPQYLEHKKSILTEAVDAEMVIQPDTQILSPTQQEEDPGTQLLAPISPSQASGTGNPAPGAQDDKVPGPGASQ